MTGPAKALPTPLEDGTSAWTPMCPVVHDGALWMGPTSLDQATAATNANLHNTHRHPAEQEALF